MKAYDTDKYGRTVGVVVVDGENVNQSLIEDGYGWQYRKYCMASFCSDWLTIEEGAKASRAGLWSDADPVPPWEWRKGARNSSYQKVSTAYEPASSGYHGNVKSHKFHSPSCSHYNCKNCTAIFSSREEAIEAGYHPCGGCKP